MASLTTQEQIAVREFKTRTLKCLGNRVRGLWIELVPENLVEPQRLARGATIVTHWEQEPLDPYAVHLPRFKGWGIGHQLPILNLELPFSSDISEDLPTTYAVSRMLTKIATRSKQRKTERDAP